MIPKLFGLLNGYLTTASMAWATILIVFNNVMFEVHLNHLNMESCDSLAFFGSCGLSLKASR